MRFFRTEPPAPVRPPVIAQKPVKPVSTPSRLPLIEGWSENEVGSLCGATSVRPLKKGEAVFAETVQSDSFFILLDGAIQLTVNLNGQPGCPGTFQKGDCIAPLPQ